MLFPHQSFESFPMTCPQTPSSPPTPPLPNPRQSREQPEPDEGSGGLVLGRPRCLSKESSVKGQQETPPLAQMLWDMRPFLTHKPSWCKHARCKQPSKAKDRGPSKSSSHTSQGLASTPSTLRNWVSPYPPCGSGASFINTLATQA